MKEWHKLLKPPEGEAATSRRFSILRKAGKPFLYLPGDRNLADATLRLYPAQTLLARILVRGVREFARMGCLIPNERVTVAVSSKSALGAFLQQLVPGSVEVPSFGVLGGNTRVPGRRFTFLLFDAAKRPVVVVKVGVSEKAKRLIQVEQDVFFPQAPHFPGMPEALAMHRGEDFFAIAYRYVEGVSPGSQHEKEAADLLNSWVDEHDLIPLRELPIQAELDILRRDNPGMEPIFQILEDTRVRPVLYHGDFAPWNIRMRERDGEKDWVALDWERCRIKGVPGWDWFHYLVQSSTLIQRAGPEKTLADLEALWESSVFLDYSRRTGIEKIPKELTFVYLLYLFRYSKPHDNAPAVHLLVERFRQKYFSQLEFDRPALKITVVTPSYKQLPWLKLCIASVADQKGVEVEHIIQDAQSGPEIEEWVRRNSKARLYVEADSGMYDAINRGFARATGDIVSWLNSDEQYLEDALVKVARYFENHPEVDVLFGDALLVGNNGTVLSYRRTIFPNIGHIQLSHLNTLSCSTFVRRSVLERGYALDTRWKAIADAVWVVDLLKAGIPMAILNEPLAIFTITDKNLGQSSLALTETKIWQRDVPAQIKWFRFGYVLRHRFSKFILGAYWPRSFTTRFYVLGNVNERITKTVSFLGFKWPQKL